MQFGSKVRPRASVMPPIGSWEDSLGTDALGKLINTFLQALEEPEKTPQEDDHRDHGLDPDPEVSQ